MKYPISKALQKELFSRAKEAMEKAIAPFSGLKVGAALLSKDGRIFTGCNIENPSLMLTICAERVALYKALSEGIKEFVTIAIVSNSNQHTPPCGTCRQIIFEFSPSLFVLTQNREEEIDVISITELIPKPFKY